MNERNLFQELMEGTEALRAEREGKITLRTTKAKHPTPLKVTAEEIVHVREKLGCSQGVFAAMLRTKLKTLQNWEQGRAQPNEQAKALILMVARNPRTLDELAALG